jgi:hypothetical protein
MTPYSPDKKSSITQTLEDVALIYMILGIAGAVAVAVGSVSIDGIIDTDGMITSVVILFSSFLFVILLKAAAVVVNTIQRIEWNTRAEIKNHE